MPETSRRTGRWSSASSTPTSPRGSRTTKRPSPISDRERRLDLPVPGPGEGSCRDHRGVARGEADLRRPRLRRRSKQSYRCLRFPWVGRPVDVPAIVASGGSRPSVACSWNGATEVASWEVLAGPTRSALRNVAAAPRAGFETVIESPTADRGSRSGRSTAPDASSGSPTRSVPAPEPHLPQSARAGMVKQARFAKGADRYAAACVAASAATPIAISTTPTTCARARRSPNRT